ncbi:DUF423 domain-containing protein [Comamonas sp. NoAH]|uniref:DUF423 domain-containing protein n=1 Tax=Comamonas halotolerans TaxID=3041496 RepID=UPI0024E08E21|nr:DUF423 domain-containing protein [Comamonas sp. NoAH]
MRKLWIPIAALLGVTGVGMAAYASHGLGFIADPTVREATRTSLQMAVQQQMFHALALLGVGILSLKGWSNRWICAAGGLFVLGVMLFSGLIYLRTFTGVETFRAFVPWGGSSLMLAWLALGVGGFKTARSA